MRRCGSPDFPAAGKSTLGAALEERLVLSGRFAYLLDGDNLRHGICGDLGFDEADRARNILRVGELARLFADAGAIAIVGAGLAAGLGPR